MKLANDYTLRLSPNSGRSSLRPVLGVGPTGPQGEQGETGETGATGAPGGSDASFAGWIEDEASDTHGALAAKIDAATKNRVLETKPLWLTGHSWIDGGTTSLWWNRLVARLHTGTATNAGYSGRTIGDVALAALRGTNSWTARTKSFVAAICTINDATVWDGSAAMFRGHAHAWKALLATITGDVAVASDTANFVYSSGFTKIAVTRSIVQGVSTNSTGSSVWRTTTTGSYFEINVTGDAVDVFLLARAAGAGLVTFTVSGSTVATLDLTATTAQDCPAVARITGLGGGTHTVRGTLTSGASMTVDSYRVPLAYPTQGIVLGEPTVIPAGGDQPTYLADVETMKTTLAGIVADFPTFTYLDLNDEPSWDTATMLTSDGKHPDDKGAAWIADTVLAELSDLDFSRGLNVTGSDDPAAYVVPAAPSTPGGGNEGTAVNLILADTFTRADSTTTMGSADTGQAYTQYGTDGVWGIASGAEYKVSGGRSFSAAECSNANIKMTATLSQVPTDTNNDAGGLACRVSAVTDGVWVGVTTTHYRFCRIKAGVVTQLNQYATTPTIGDVVEIRTSGTVVEVWINGTKRMEHLTLTDNSTATKHGFYGTTLSNGSGGARFTDLTIYEN